MGYRKSSGSNLSSLCAKVRDINAMQKEDWEVLTADQPVRRCCCRGRIRF